LLPLGPKLMASVGLDGEAKRTTAIVDDDSLCGFNEMQVTTALEYVFYRTGSGLTDFARDVVRMRSSSSIGNIRA
nr:hypothetical protein [Micromonospora sp. DSM 115978]